MAQYACGHYRVTCFAPQFLRIFLVQAYLFSVRVAQRTLLRGLALLVLTRLF